jgi:hypothetical protein
VDAGGIGERQLVEVAEVVFDRPAVVTTAVSAIGLVRNTGRYSGKPPLSAALSAGRAIPLGRNETPERSKGSSFSMI